MTKFNSYLSFEGNAEEAFNFYKSIFGGEFASLVRFKDMPMEGMNLPKEVENNIMHVGLPVGNDQMLMGADAPECFGQKVVQGNNVQISVHPDSREEADRLFTSLSEGGKVQVPIADQPWGDYYGNFQDKFGINWMINYHKE